MKEHIHYASYKDYMVKYDEDTLTMTMLHVPTKSAANLTFDGLYENGKRVFGIEEYTSCQVQNSLGVDQHKLSVLFNTDADIPKCAIHATITSKGITMVFNRIGHYTVRAEGDIVHGNTEDCFAINTRNTASEVIRAAIGPAASAYDNAIYNKLTDSAFAIDGCKDLVFSYNWDKNKYDFVLQTFSEGLTERIYFSVKKDLLAQKYDIDFAPLKKRGRYDAPPAGWMTWYAVKFNASEEAVLRNTDFQEKHLKDFGANTIWVDWEWCHQRYEKERFDGVDSFHPDTVKYPNGLGFVAQEIKKAGFVPALWLGFTNDACLTEYEKSHPEISLSHHDTWSGRYYYDISHPEFLNGFLAKAVGQVKDWGYEVVKFDTLPNCITAHERYHANMYNPELTTYEAYRGMLEKIRGYLGEDFYMLACSGEVDPVVLWGTGIFDASRVGPDVFTWSNFVRTIDRIRQFFPLHNIALINDPDNVVLREEFSTYEQAVSRICIVSLLGLPLTFGDDLPKLSSERLDILKRALPVMNVHPTDFNNAICDGKTQVLQLAIEMPFERYSVAAVMNLTEEAAERHISLKETLRLPEGEYLVYDYFDKEYLGIYKDSMLLSVAPYDTKVLSFRKKSGKPQVISTSRHITQGAAEIKNMQWDDNTNTLSVTSSLVKNDLYVLTVYIPEGYVFKTCNQGDWVINSNGLVLTVKPDSSGEYELQLQFDI